MAGLVDLRGIDGRLAVLRANNEQGRFIDVLPFKRVSHATESLVGFLQRVVEDRGWSACAVFVPTRLPREGCVCRAAAIFIVLFQFLSDADGLEVHPKHRRDTGCLRPVVVQALDLVDDGLDLLLIIQHRANHAAGGVETVVVGDLRSVEILHAFTGRTVHQIISGVFVRPSRATTFAPDDFEDGIGLHGVVGIKPDTLTVLVQAIRQCGGINDVQRDRRSATVPVNAFIEHLHVTDLPGAIRVCRVEHAAIVTDVVEQPVADGRAASHESQKAGKRV